MLLDDLLDTQAFAARHIGPDERDERAMLEFLGLPSREALIAEALPAAIRLAAPLELPAPRTESGRSPSCARSPPAISSGAPTSAWATAPRTRRR